MNIFKKFFGKVKGESSEYSKTALGVRVKSNGQEFDAEYIDIAMRAVTYWIGEKFDPSGAVIEIMPPCPTHGKCCFIDGANHYHGRMHFGVAQTSANLCTLHNLMAQIVGRKVGSKEMHVFDRLDWIGKDYD